MSIRTNKGQSLIEACLIAPIIMAVFIAIGLLSFRGFIYYYADFHLYEAMICTQHSKASRCQEFLRQKISQVLIVGDIQKISIHEGFQEVRGHLSLSFKKNSAAQGLSAMSLEISKNIPLPLMKR